MKNDYLGIRIGEAEKKELVEIAEYEGMSLSKLCEISLKQKISDWKKKTQKMETPFADAGIDEVNKEVEKILTDAHKKRFGFKK